MRRLEKLGESACSKVYLVDEDDKRYAVKYVGYGYSAVAILEMDALTHFRDVPEIIDLIGVIKTNKSFGLILELMEGDLTSLKADWDEVYPTLLRSMIRALATLEQQSYCHFDIKPHNILYQRQPLRFKLADFGLARVVRQHSPTEDTLYTIQYRPPELLAGQDRKQFNMHVCDVWALGMTLTEYWRGKSYFKIHQSEEKILKKIQSGLIYPPLPDGMMSLDPLFRPTATALLARLKFSEPLAVPEQPIEEDFPPALELIELGTKLEMTPLAIIRALELSTRIQGYIYPILRVASICYDDEPFYYSHLHGLLTIDVIEGLHRQIRQMLSKIRYQIHHPRVIPVLDRFVKLELNLTTIPKEHFVQPVENWFNGLDVYQKYAG